MNKIIYSLIFILGTHFAYSQTISNYIHLTTDQVVPSIAANEGRGDGTAVLDGTNLTVKFIYTNLAGNVGLYRLRGPAAVGQSGAVLQTLLVLQGTNYGTFSKTWGFAPNKLEEFKAGLWYMEIEGYIRAQLPGTNEALFGIGAPVLKGITFEKLKPKDNKKLPTFKSSKGFSAAGVIKKSGSGSNIVVDAVYVSLVMPSTNGNPVAYGRTKLTPKTASKGQAKKGIIYTFKTKRDGNKVGIGTPSSLQKGAAVNIVFQAVANDPAYGEIIYSQTHQATIQKVK